MAQELIDGSVLRKMIFSAANFLEENKQTIDAMNVFPVPDGDTGTNMAMTMLAAAKEAKAVAEDDVSKIAEALSRGALKGARGNSGVILSQLFRGFAIGVKGLEKIGVRGFAQAIQMGVDMAYRAVMKPVEGTMLTVARAVAQEAKKIARSDIDFVSFYREIIKVAKSTLEKTPEMLPVLKEAGVVDSGGMGLLYILMGASRALDEDFEVDSSLFATPADVEQNDTSPKGEIEYGYCTEFFIKNLHPYVEEGDVEKLKERLGRIGDSVVVVCGSDGVKVHVHTNMPGKVLQLGLRFGELSSIKIDNMREQHRHLDRALSGPEKKSKKKFGVMAVAMGEGIASIFRDLSVDYVLEGGQTMNPSIDDILKGVEQVNAREVFILPNNSNIILAAKQAQQLSDTTIHVIPSKTIPQGLAAMLAYNPDMDSETNVKRMTEALQNVRTGQVTYAVRNSRFDGISINEGDIIGICDGKIVAAGKDIERTALELIDKMIEEDAEVVTVLYGSDVSEEDANRVAKFIEDKYPDVEVEVHAGGQPIYYYIFSVE